MKNNIPPNIDLTSLYPFKVSYAGFLKTSRLFKN